MDNKKINKWVILWILIFALILFLGIRYLKPYWDERNEREVKEFDILYKPVCDSLGGIYKQEGSYRNNVCYLNDSGILRKGYMNKINGVWHLTDV